MDYLVYFLIILNNFYNDLKDNYYDKETLNEVFTPITGAIYTEYTVDGYIRRNNLQVFVNANISPGFCNAGQWWAFATIADGWKPDTNTHCNINGYKLGWSSPLPVAGYVTTEGKIMMYAQDNTLTNFTISASWFTNQ